MLGPRGSPWIMWLRLPSRRPWFLDGLSLEHWLGIYFWENKQIRGICRDERNMDAQEKPAFNWDVWRKGKPWLERLSGTELKLCECFLSGTTGNTRLRQTFLPVSSVPLCFLQMFSCWMNRCPKREDPHMFSATRCAVRALQSQDIYPETWLGARD